MRRHTQRLPQMTTRINQMQYLHASSLVWFCADPLCLPASHSNEYQNSWGHNLIWIWTVIRSTPRTDKSPFSAPNERTVCKSMLSHRGCWFHSFSFYVSIVTETCKKHVLLFGICLDCGLCPCCLLWYADMRCLTHTLCFITLPAAGSLDITLCLKLQYHIFMCTGKKQLWLLINE